MRLTIPAKAFAALAAAASLPTPRRNTIPALSHLHCRAKDNSLRLIGTDLDTWSAATDQAAVAAPGDACLPAEGLKAALARMAGDVTLEVVDGKAKIAAGRMSVVLSTLPPEDFPLVVPKGDAAEIVGGIDAIRVCAPFASNEETRYYLCGVCMDSDTAVATDGRFLTTAPITGGAGQIIPAAAFPAILKTGGRLYCGETLWRCEAEGRVLTGKLIDATFIDWRRVMPAADEWFTIGAEALLDAIDAATLGSADRVMISTLGGNLVVSGHGWEASAQSAEIDVDADVHAEAAQMFSRGIITTALGRIKGVATVKLGPMIVRIDHEGENAGVTLAFGQRVPGNVSIGDAVAA